jgi:RNA polymerase sigma-70 factor, ECF subfamily
MTSPAAAPQAAFNDGVNAPADDSDLALVHRAQSGDAKAFDALVTKYRSRIFSMTYTLVQNQEDAWDLSQEAFIKAWRALPGFKGDSGFYTWLYRIAHNAGLDWLRKKRIQSAGEFDDNRADHQPDPTAEAVPHGFARPDRALSNAELGQRIKVAIAQLSEDHRSIVMLREVEGLSYEEIAQVLNIAVGSVMSRLFYARKKLQTLLQDDAP